MEKNVRSEPEKPDVIIIPADAGSPPKPEPKPHVLEPAPEEVEVLKATVEEITISNAFNIEHFSLKVDGKTIALDPKKDNLAK